MPSYQERSELNRRLADQAYFDAKRKKIEPQKKDVRIGGMDGQTGRYQVFHADGGFSSNGVRTFDGTPPSDRFVRGQQNPNSNAIALGYRDYVRTEFLNRGEEDEIPLLQINLKTTSRNLVAKTPVYRFNNTLTSNPIEAEPEILYENNKFLYNSGGGFEASYFTTTDSFKPENDNIEDKTLSEVLEEESTKDSREGIAVIRYNYSYFEVGLFSERNFSLSGSTTKAKIRLRNIYDYTDGVLFTDNNIIVFDRIRETPEDGQSKATLLAGYSSSFGITAEQALIVYDYHQTIINILRNQEYKARDINNFIRNSYIYIRNTETEINIELPDPPAFLWAGNPFVGLGLGFASNKYANDYVGYEFDIGRSRSYIVERDFNKPMYLEVIDFTATNIRPDFIVAFPPYNYSLDNIRIDLSLVEFTFDFLDLSEPDAPVSLPNQDVAVTIDISAEFYYRINENSADFVKLKDFTFSFSNGSIEGDFIFGDLFVFDSVYLSYYIVITSFEVSI